MTKVTRSHGAAAVLVLASLLHAQVPSDATNVAEAQFIRLDYATFDPTAATPEVPPALRGGPDTGLWIVQTRGLPDDTVRDAIKSTGAQIQSYLPDEAYVVRMHSGQASQVAALHTMVRWVGYYEPAYRLEPALLAEIRAGQVAGTRRYNILVVDKRADKPGLEAKIRGLGGKVIERHEGGPLFTVELDGLQMLAVARCDEVLFMDRWTPNTEDMNNARAQGGANYIESAGGYTGTGVRGHVHEGVEAGHADFNTAMTNVDSCGSVSDHGHCTAGIIFGNGTSAASARGMAPDAVGFFTTYTCRTVSRPVMMSNIVNTHHCMFTTASWGGGQTTAYTTVSAEADDIVFDNRIPWTNSMSNLGNQNARPEAWAKNVIGIGGLYHRNNADPNDDVWSYVGMPFTPASIGPAADGRQKPDLCAYYEDIWTSDVTGAGGYAAGNSYTAFGGTSGATPICAGHNALAIEMYTDGIFQNTLPASPTVANRFTNRPFAQTLKALMICGARQYDAANAQTQRRHQGWGFPNLQRLYDFRNRIFIVPENNTISQGQTDSFTIRVSANTPELKVCMTYLDPQGNPAAAIDRINDLSLRVTSPTGTVYNGNVGLVAAGGLGNNYSSSGGVFNTVDTVECVFIQNPAAGHWTVQVVATLIAQDGHVATAGVDSTYALVAYGGNHIPGATCNTYVPSSDPTVGTCNLVPLGPGATTTLVTLFAQNNQNSVGGAIYFDINATNGVYVNGLSLNSPATAGTAMTAQVYRRAGTSVGAEGSAAGWIPETMGFGTAAGVDLPSDIALNSPFYLPPGLHGIAVVAYGFAHHYTNGANSYSDANITIQAGSATNVPFTGSAFTPRTPNIELRYNANVASNSWNNIRTQTIVRQKELVSGPITGLAFSCCSTGRHWNDSLLIRLSHVPAGHTLSSTFATNLPSPVTVLNVSDYSWHLTANTWSEIGLQNAFTYNGTSDLVIDIVSRGNFHTAGAAFHRDGALVNRIYAAGWTGATPATSTGTESVSVKMRLQQGCANAHEYGWSCGTLVADYVGQPVLGQNFSFRCAGAPANNFMFLILGFGNAPPTYPFNLAFIALPGCDLFHETFATVSAFANGVGTATYTYNFPVTAAGVGFKFYGQWFTPDTSAPGDFAVSNYVRMLCGNTP